MTEAAAVEAAVVVDAPAAIEIPVGIIKKVARFAAKERVRYALNAVLIDSAEQERAGAFSLVATDGRRLVAVTLATASPIPRLRVLVPLGVLARSSATDILAADKDGATVRPSDPEKDGAWSNRAVYKEGSFPNWREVMPPEGEGKVGRVSFNAAYIGDACRLFVELIGSGSAVYTMATACFQFGGDGPSLLYIKNPPKDLPLDKKRSLDILAVRVAVMPVAISEEK